MEIIKACNLRDNFDYCSKTKNLYPKNITPLNLLQDGIALKKFAKEHPDSYKVKRTSDGYNIIRETADKIRTIHFSKERGFIDIRHEYKKTGKVSIINTLGDFIENYHCLDKKHKIIKFNDFKDMLSYFKNNKSSIQSKISNILKKIKII